MRNSLRLLLITLVVLTHIVLPLHAESLFDDFEDEDFFTSDDVFSEDVGQDEFGTGFSDEELTEGGDFVEDDLSGSEGLDAAERRAQLRLTGERDLLPLNAAWGAGTGLLIGGWLAFIDNGTSRDTQRAIGLGIVVGALIGVAVGTKGLFAPGAPTPPPTATHQEAPSGLMPVVAMGPNAPMLAMQYNLRF